MVTRKDDFQKYMVEVRGLHPKEAKSNTVAIERISYQYSEIQKKNVDLFKYKDFEKVKEICRSCSTEACKLYIDFIDYALSQGCYESVGVCGSNEVLEKEFFCFNCGRKLESNWLCCPYCKADMNLKKCSKCETYLSDDFKFCPKCGKSTGLVSKRNFPHRPPEIEFVPNDENLFKKMLMETEKAKRRLFFYNGKEEENVWTAKNIKPATNIRGNIQSTPYYRSWRETGLVKIVCSIIDDSKID